MIELAIWAVFITWGFVAFGKIGAGLGLLVGIFLSWLWLYD